MAAGNLKRLTLREQAETAVRDMIASYRFTPGKRINVERLAKDLGVSRTPIWQALKNLEKEGLVTHVPNQGIRMSRLTLQMAYDLYVVRGQLEGLAGRFAAENINKGCRGKTTGSQSNTAAHVNGDPDAPGVTIG